MTVSVILSVYKAVQELKLVLEALSRQSFKNFEVIISEDDNSAEVKSLLINHRDKYPFPVIHVCQEDIGFRKCKSLNHSIEASNGDFLIFLDGDCIPHPKLVEEYYKNCGDNKILFGRRVCLGESLSKKIVASQNLNNLNFFKLLTNKTSRLEEGIYIPFYRHTKENDRLLGCNMGIPKNILVLINGFDEDYNFPGGGEDSDIEWRLMKRGNTTFVSMKFKAIVYHLYHETRMTEKQLAFNTAFLNNKKQTGDWFCKNGLIK